jgi:transposase-like protein
MSSNKIISEEKTLMSKPKIVKKLLKVNEEEVKNYLDKQVKDSVEVTLNTMLDAEADNLCGAKRYERSPDRTDFRAGHYDRKLLTKAGEVSLQVPKLRKLTFETQIIERYRRKESSVEEAMIEMYLAGVSVRRVEDITEALWGAKVSPGTISNLNKKVYEKIEVWRNQPITGKHPYVYLDGIWLKRCWGGEVKNVSVLVAFGVNADGYREILGAVEGAKEDKASWSQFLRHLKSRGLRGVKLFVSDKCLGLVESLADFYPDSSWQRCIVHFYRNVMSSVPYDKMRTVVSMLKAIHAQEDKAEARKKAKSVVEKLKIMKLGKAAEIVENGIDETLTYMDFPSEHWKKIRTNNPLERLMREIRRRTRVVGAFPDGNSALMLVCARLRYVAGTKWGLKRYMNMDLLKVSREVAA